MQRDGEVNMYLVFWQRVWSHHYITYQAKVAPNTKTCWLAGRLADLMVALLACSHPAQLPCLSSPPSVIGKPQWSPRWERCVSLAGSLQQGLGVPLVQPAPLQSLPSSNPCQVARSHTDLMYSH